MACLFSQGIKKRLLAQNQVQNRIAKAKEMPLKEGFSRETRQKNLYASHAASPKLAQAASLSPGIIGWVAAPAVIYLVFTIVCNFAAIVPNIASLFLDARLLIAGLVLATTGLILASGPPVHMEVKDVRRANEKELKKKHEQYQQTPQGYNPQGQQPSRLRTSTATSLDPAAMLKRHNSKHVHKTPQAGVPTQRVNSSSNNTVIIGKLNTIQTMLAELTAGKRDSAGQYAPKSAELAQKLANVPPKQPERQNQMQQQQAGERRQTGAVGSVGGDQNPKMVRALPRAEQPKILQHSGMVAHDLCDTKQSAERLPSVRAISGGSSSSSTKRLLVLLSVHGTKSLEDSAGVRDVGPAAQSQVPDQVDNKAAGDDKVARKCNDDKIVRQDMTDAKEEGTHSRMTLADGQQYLSHYEKSSIAEAVNRLDAKRKQQALAIIRNDAPALIKPGEGATVIAIKDVPNTVFMKLITLLRTRPGYWPIPPPLPLVSAAANSSFAASGLANRCAASTTAIGPETGSTAPNLHSASTAATCPEIDSKSPDLIPSIPLSDLFLRKLPWPSEGDQPCPKIPSTTQARSGPQTGNEALMEYQRQLMQLEAQNRIRLTIARRQQEEQERILSREQQQQQWNLNPDRSQYDPTEAPPGLGAREAGQGQHLRMTIQEDEKKKGATLSGHQIPKKEQRVWSRNGDCGSRELDEVSKQLDSISLMQQRPVSRQDEDEDEDEDGFVVVEKEKDQGKDEAGDDDHHHPSRVRHRRTGQADCCSR